MRAMRLAMVVAVLTLACEPPPSDVAAPGGGGVATIQQAATCGGWHQPPCLPYIPGDVRIIEDLTLTHGMNTSVFSLATAGPPASLPGQYALYPNPTVGTRIEYWSGGQWWPLFTNAIAVARNYGADFVQVSNSRLCLLAWGCTPITVTQVNSTFYRDDFVIPRNARLIRHVWYRQCAFSGPWVQVLAVGPTIDVTTAPEGTFNAVAAQGVYANLTGWAGANCPGEYGAYSQHDYVRCDGGGQHRNEVCIPWPSQGTCDPRQYCPPF